MSVKILERSIQTERGRMAWLETGRGWPLILLHGFALTADMWRPQLEAAPEGWRFIAPDYQSPAAVSMDDYAADVLALMNSLEVEHAVIGGLSMGGYVTFAMHRLEPARFSGMVLADTRSQPDSAQARDGRIKLLDVLATAGPDGVADELIPKLLSEPGRREGSEALAQTRAMIRGSAPEAIVTAIRALLSRPDSTPGLSAISCSALVLVGDADVITPPAEAELMQRAIPRATLCVIPGAGHLSNLEQPAAFSRALGDFLLAPQ